MDEAEAHRFLDGEELLDELRDRGTVTIYADRDTTAFGRKFRAGDSVTVRPHDKAPAAIARSLDTALESGGPWRGWVTSEFLEHFGVLEAASRNN